MPPLTIQENTLFLCKEITKTQKKILRISLGTGMLHDVVGWLLIMNCEKICLQRAFLTDLSIFK